MEHSTCPWLSEIREEVLDEAIVIATGQVVEILLMDIVEAQVVGHFKCLLAENCDGLDSVVAVDVNSEISIVSICQQLSSIVGVVHE
jgi:hypothetical protein